MDTAVPGTIAPKTEKLPFKSWLVVGLLCVVGCLELSGSRDDNHHARFCYKICPYDRCTVWLTDIGFFMGLRFFKPHSRLPCR
jgi:hypothetical protein